MTLIELTVCFVILSALLVVATQIIHSTTEIYYDTKTNSFGTQASEIIATEIRGEIEDALPKKLLGNSSYYINIVNGSNTAGSYIEFIDKKGNQVKYSLEIATNTDDNKFKRFESSAYDSNRLKQISSTADLPSYNLSKEFDSKYIGMNYVIKEIKFQPAFESGFTSDKIESTEDVNKLRISDYPILKMTVKVGNNLYGEYECVEYIPLYNFYGISNISSYICISN